MIDPNELLKMAALIDKVAGEVTDFVCEGCGNTETLANMNAMNAEKAGDQAIEDITVDDKVQCPDCGGVMAADLDEVSSEFYDDGTPPAEESVDEEPVAEPAPATDEVPADDISADSLNALAPGTVDSVEEKQAEQAPLSLNRDYGEVTASMDDTRKEKFNAYMSFGT